MSAKSFFEKIVGRQQERKATALNDYRQLVESIVNETEPEPDEVERLLAESSKTIQDLQQDCERLSRRMRLIAALDRRPALEKERAKIDEQIATADRVLEEADAKHDEVTLPLYERRREVDQTIREANSAEANLINECENTDLRRELENVNAELNRLSNDRRELLDQANHLGKQAVAENARADRQLDMAFARKYRDKAASHEKHAEARRRDAKRTEKAHDEMLKRRERLEKQMREV